MGWNTAADGSGDFYRPGESLEMPASDLTLFADWVGIHEISVTGMSSGDEFGFSVDIEGDYAVVGARGYDYSAGTAYVYERTGDNTWGNRAVISAPESS